MIKTDSINNRFSLFGRNIKIWFKLYNNISYLVVVFCEACSANIKRSQLLKHSQRLIAYVVGFRFAPVLFDSITSLSVAGAGITVLYFSIFASTSFFIN